MQKAIFKEKMDVVEDIHSFMKENDVDEDVLGLILKFQDLMKEKKGKVKKSVKKSDGKKRQLTFWNDFMKKNLPIVRKEQEGLDEDDDGWIEKDGRWEMKEVAKRWAIFKEQDNFKALEAEFKKKQSEESVSNDEEIVPKKEKPKKTKSKKVLKAVPQKVDVDDNDDDGNESDTTSDSDDDDN